MPSYTLIHILYVAPSIHSRLNGSIQPGSSIAMQPTVQSILSKLLLFAAHASSHPSRFARGLPGAVYACSLSNWGGECVWRPLGFTPDEPCLSTTIGNIPAGFTFGSIGPDEFGGCLLYGSADCDSSGSGNSTIAVLTWPGNAAIDRVVGSLWCWTCKMSDCSDMKEAPELQIHRPKQPPPRLT